MVRLIALIGVCCSLVACSYEEVVFKGVEHVAVGRFDQGGLAMTAHVVLENPNKYRIHVKDPDVDLFLNDIYIGKARLQEKVTLLPRTTATYAIPLQAGFDGEGSNLLGALLSTALSRKGELRMKGTVTGGVGLLLRKKFPFEERHTIQMDR